MPPTITVIRWVFPVTDETRIMTLFRNVVFIAALSGLLSGLVMTVLQTFTTVPLILQAEALEAAGLGQHEHAATPPRVPDAPVPFGNVAVETHAHAAEGRMPADVFERFVFTALSNIVTAIGFGLVLVAVSEAFGGVNSWRQGMFWGFAGFAVFTLAPGLGLPPELPGMPAADLLDRQVWWVATVAATSVGLGLIAFRGTVLFSFVGLALIVVPHWFGAPRPDDLASPVSEELHRRFIVAATLTSLVFWVALGGLVGVFRSRSTRASGWFRGRLA